MRMSGQYRVAAPRQAVWDALNDPEVLKQAIPGCEEIDKVSDTEFTAKVRARVGPVSARFAGTVTLSDVDPPNGYTIAGTGKGAAGFAKGGAKVRLEADGEATILHYDVEASVGGRLAQVGSRLIDGVAKKMAEDFFGKFAGAVPVEGADAAPAAAEPADAAGPPARGLSPVLWISGLIAIVLILLAVFGLAS